MDLQVYGNDCKNISEIKTPVVDGNSMDNGLNDSMALLGGAKILHIYDWVPAIELEAPTIYKNCETLKTNDSLVLCSSPFIVSTKGEYQSNHEFVSIMDDPEIFGNISNCKCPSEPCPEQYMFCCSCPFDCS